MLNTFNQLSSDYQNVLRELDKFFEGRTPREVREHVDWSYHVRAHRLLRENELVDHLNLVKS